MAVFRSGTGSFAGRDGHATARCLVRKTFVRSSLSPGLRALRAPGAPYIFLVRRSRLRPPPRPCCAARFVPVPCAAGTRDRALSASCLVSRPRVVPRSGSASRAPSAVEFLVPSFTLAKPSPALLRCALRSGSLVPLAPGTGLLPQLRPAHVTVSSARFLALCPPTRARVSLRVRTVVWRSAPSPAVALRDRFSSRRLPDFPGLAGGPARSTGTRPSPFPLPAWSFS